MSKIVNNVQLSVLMENKNKKQKKLPKTILVPSRASIP